MPAVVVHDGVHVLDPDGVDGAVKHEPREVFPVLVGLAPERRKDALGPLVVDDVEEAWLGER